MNFEYRTIVVFIAFLLICAMAVLVGIVAMDKDTPANVAIGECESKNGVIIRDLRSNIVCINRTALLK